MSARVARIAVMPEVTLSVATALRFSVEYPVEDGDFP
jgi:hypothetical protein